MPLPYILLVCFVFLGSLNSHATSSEQDLRVHERLNKIFFWQIADELKLTTQQEKKMVALVEDIQARRRLALEQKNRALADLAKTENAGALKKSLAHYKEALEILAKLEAEEFKSLEKILEPTLLAKFYQIREAVIAKVKEALSKQSK